MIELADLPDAAEPVADLPELGLALEGFAEVFADVGCGFFLFKLQTHRIMDQGSQTQRTSSSHPPSSDTKVATAEAIVLQPADLSIRNGSRTVCGDPRFSRLSRAQAIVRSPPDNIPKASRTTQPPRLNLEAYLSKPPPRLGRCAT